MESGHPGNTTVQALAARVTSLVSAGQQGDNALGPPKGWRQTCRRRLLAIAMANATRSVPLASVLETSETTTVRASVAIGPNSEFQSHPGLPPKPPGAQAEALSASSSSPPTGPSAHTWRPRSKSTAPIATGPAPWRAR